MTVLYFFCRILFLGITASPQEQSTSVDLRIGNHSRKETPPKESRRPPADGKLHETRRKGGHLGERPPAADKILEGSETAFGRALLHSLGGVDAGQAAVLARNHNHRPAPDRRWQRHPGQIDHLAQPRAGRHTHSALQHMHRLIVLVPVYCACLSLYVLLCLSIGIWIAYTRAASHPEVGGRQLSCDAVVV